MKTKTLIQSQANVIKISSLNIGDTIKIVDDSLSYSIDINYGVVIDILNNGEKTFFQILSYKKEYNGVSSSIKTHGGDKDLNIFPASPDEVRDYLEESVKELSDKLEKEKEGLNIKIEALNKTREFLSGDMSKALKSASYTEVTQSEYQKEKIQLEMEKKMKQIS
tara:strand:- start:365 stop:859 length:495 start_codon:yes stop_codon:yes gene_type:complete